MSSSRDMLLLYWLPLVLLEIEQDRDLLAR
jgi:hypothetical protein